MAASDRFIFTVEGRGGHGAMPHLAADPVLAGSAIVMALQVRIWAGRGLQVRGAEAMLC